MRGSTYRNDCISARETKRIPIIDPDWLQEKSRRMKNCNWFSDVIIGNIQEHRQRACASPKGIRVIEGIQQRCGEDVFVCVREQANLDSLISGRTSIWRKGWSWQIQAFIGTRNSALNWSIPTRMCWIRSVPPQVAYRQEIPASKQERLIHCPWRRFHDDEICINVQIHEEAVWRVLGVQARYVRSGNRSQVWDSHYQWYVLLGIEWIESWGWSTSRRDKNRWFEDRRIQIDNYIMSPREQRQRRQWRDQNQRRRCH